jgi:hypothetical protein
VNATIRKALGLVLLIVGTFIFVNTAPIVLTLILAPQLAAFTLSTIGLKLNPLLLAVAGLVISLAMMFLGGILLFSAPSRS